MRWPPGKHTHRSTSEESAELKLEADPDLFATDVTDVTDSGQTNRQSCQCGAPLILDVSITSGLCTECKLSGAEV